MTRVDFYILPDMDTEARDRFACRLANQAVDNGHQVHVHVDNEDAERSLDELMWAYPAYRFLPHALGTESLDERTRVSISYDLPGPESDQMLINLGADVPKFFGRFERVAEIFVHPQIDAGRQRYKYYRDRGYPLFHHDMESWEDR